jgi:hypothetical protein
MSALAANLHRFVTRMRHRQGDLFDSAVAVTRTTASGLFDPDTASYGDGTETVLYRGRALVRPQAFTVDQDSGRTSIVVDTYLVKLPADTPVAVGDNITVIASTHDAGLVGLLLRVSDVPADEWQISRRVVAVREGARPT